MFTKVTHLYFFPLKKHLQITFFGLIIGVTHPDEEDGEAEPTTVKYKPEKLVSFPGFNDNIPRGATDVSNVQNNPLGCNYNNCAKFVSFWGTRTR